MDLLFVKFKNQYIRTEITAWHVITLIDQDLRLGGINPDHPRSRWVQGITQSIGNLVDFTAPAVTR